MRRLVIIGASCHGKVVAEIARSTNTEIAGFIDDRTHREPYLGTLESLPLKDEVEYVIAIGSNATRKRIAESHDLPYARLVHVFSWVPLESIGEGTIATAGTIVNPDAKIGRHVILNTACSIDHDCIIGDYCHICPGVHLGGDVHIGEGTQLGVGVSVIPGIRIGAWSIIGAGGVVVRDIPDNVVAYGVPARVKRTL